MCYTVRSHMHHVTTTDLVVQSYEMVQSPVRKQVEPGTVTATVGYERK